MSSRTLRSLLPLFYAAGLFSALLVSPGCAEDKAEAKGGWTKPSISIYNPPRVEQSTSPVFRTVDPQIIQKLIDLLQENNLGKLESGTESPTLETIKTLITPEGLEIKNRYTRLGVALS